MMPNTQILAIFRELAEALVQKKESWFKVRAYRKVAEEIEKLPIELSALADKGRLREIPGVGKAIEKKIIEIITTGRLQLLDRLKAEIEEGKVEQCPK